MASVGKHCSAAPGRTRRLGTRRHSIDRAQIAVIEPKRLLAKPVRRFGGPLRRFPQATPRRLDLGIGCAMTARV